MRLFDPRRRSDSQDFADDTSRPAFSAPRFWASCPAMAIGRFVPGQRQRPGGKLGGSGDDKGTMAAGLQPALRRDSPAAIWKLLDGWESERIGLRFRVDIREGAVGCTKVDANDVRQGGYSISISAGARTVTFCAGVSLGSSTRSTRQPLWRRMPCVALPLAGTLPSSLTLFGSPESTL